MTLMAKMAAAMGRPTTRTSVRRSLRLFRNDPREIERGILVIPWWPRLGAWVARRVSWAGGRSIPRRSGSPLHRRVEDRPKRVSTFDGAYCRPPDVGGEHPQRHDSRPD